MNFHADILANLIISTYLWNSRCVIVFTDDNYFNHDFIIPIVNVKVENDSLRGDVIFNYFGCQDIIIKTNKPLTVFKAIEDMIKHNLERFNKRKYIFFEGVDMKESIMDIFELQELTYISDLVIVKEENNTTNNETIYNIWSHKYVGVEDTNKAELIDVWYSSNESFMFNKNLFPNKLKNQMGRTLKMATFQYEPYSIIGGTLEDELKGSEMVSMITFAKHFNMTYELVINSEDYWGVLYDNWTGNGLLYNIATDEADIGFAALYTWEAEYHFLDLSMPVIRTGITCLAPAPKLAAGWLTPLYSYSRNMWCLVASTFLLSILVHFIFVLIKFQLLNHQNSTILFKVSLFRNSLFTIFKVFIIQLIKQKEIPEGLSSNVFIGVLFMFSLFLSSSYSSGLATVMTIPTYENAVDTVDEIIETGIHWVGTHSGWTDSIVQSNDPKYQALVKQFIAISSEEKIRELSQTSNYAFALERLPHHNYAIGRYMEADVIEDYILMSEDFYWEESVIMTRKSSILLPQLNQFILKVFEAGLITYWQNEATMLYMDTKVQKGVNTFTGKNKHYVVKLKWNHVAGIFTILGFGYVISILAFFIEVATYKYLNKG